MTLVLGNGVSTVIDARTRRVPNMLTAGIALAGLALAGFRQSPYALAVAVGGALVGLALMLPGHLIGGTGAGDVKLFAACGTVLGPSATVTAFLYTAIAGGLLAAYVAYSRGRLRATVRRTADLVATRGANVADIEQSSSDNRFAFAPAIACGVLAAALGV